MAEQRQGGQPSEPPSEKRLRDAHRRGEVPRSRELISAAVFLTVALTLWGIWPDLFGKLRHAMAHGIRTATETNMLSVNLVLYDGLRTLLETLAPVLIVSFFAAIVAGIAHIGPVFTFHPVKPDLQRLAPIKNLKRMLGKTALFELFKSVVKILGAGYLAFDAAWDHLPEILHTLGRSPEAALSVVAEGLIAIAFRVSILIASLAVVDILYQRHTHRRRLRMTKLEVQREQKEMEGDPQRKAERKRIHREIADHQMLEAVTQADCIIINPDHVAVAIRYDQKQMQAPIVLAQGQRIIAAKIKQIAKDRGIPIIRNVPLAHALLELEINEEIPPALYDAVAEILRFVYQITERSG